MGFFPEGSGEKMTELDRRVSIISLFNNPFGIIVKDGLKLNLYIEELVKRFCSSHDDLMKEIIMA